MAQPTLPAKTEIFLTGVTGFVGKVVLEELLRRSDELNLGRVWVLIRKKRGELPEQRFAKVATSRVLAGIAPGWQDRVEIIGGELSQPACGVAAATRARMQPHITHIIHCAASVEFTLPIAEAAAANITSGLNVLELARACPNLIHMTAVSTAYVNPASKRPMAEALVPLPFEAEEAYADILAGRADEKALMAMTGHPNTYTLTKCINEHLLHQRRGDVPLSIVRPSIISATLQHPFPGWIDSHAAFAGFVALIGAGHLTALHADTDVHLDLVPCDVVAERAIDTCLFTTPAPADEEPHVRYAVAGLADSTTIGACLAEILAFFTLHPIDREPKVKWIGTRRTTFKLKSAQYHGTRKVLANSLLTLTGKHRTRKQYNKVMDKIKFLNTIFPYFTQNEFDFRPSVSLAGPDYDPLAYIRIACAGIYTHLTHKDASQMSLAGRRHRDGSPDLRWIMKQPAGNWAIRGASYALRKSLRRCTESVTFDRPAFEAARAKMPDDTLVVIIPTHRSYMDFLVCSYLFFARSDLGIRIPHIAAAEEFSHIPVLGWLFKQTHAFYIRRGGGGEDKELTDQIRDLVKRRETLEFFIEGARSRSRQFLQPRRGLLRALQGTGETCMILPVAITYDRVPEERSFLRELQGEGKPKMQLRKLLMWTAKMASGRVDLGRIHVTCGEPLKMDPTVDVKQLSIDIMAELQRHTHATTHHLRCFLARNPIEGVDEHALREGIERRGGQVFESSLDGHEDVDAEIERTMRYNWQHLFFPEARALYPDHAAIAHHIHGNAFAAGSTVELADVPNSAPLRRLVEVLLRPVCAEYVATARWLATTHTPIEEVTAASVVRSLPQCHLPTVQGALSDLLERGLLVRKDKTTLAWGVPPESRREALLAYADDCAWPDAHATITAEMTDGAVDNRIDWIPRTPLARGAGI